MGHTSSRKDRRGRPRITLMKQSRKDASTQTYLEIKRTAGTDTSGEGFS